MADIFAAELLLPDEALKELAEACERYLVQVLGRIPGTLDFYKMIV